MPDLTIENLKLILIKNCMLTMDAADIDEDTPFFGPKSLEIDSLDVLQMSVAIEKEYGVKLTDPEEAKRVFTNLENLREWLLRKLDE